MAHDCGLKLAKEIQFEPSAGPAQFPQIIVVKAYQ
jgi:hypothetical protein